MGEMSLVSSVQLQQLVGSIMLGGILAISWEVLSLGINGSPVMCAAGEAGFLVVGFVSLFLMGQSLGAGEFRLFMLLGVIAGFIVVKAFAGEYIRWFLGRVVRGMKRVVSVLLQPVLVVVGFAKKVKIFCKNLFANAKNWFTITDIQKEGIDRNTPFVSKGRRRGVSTEMSAGSGGSGASAIRGNSRNAGSSSNQSGRNCCGDAAGYRSDPDSSDRGTTIGYP